MATRTPRRMLRPWWAWLAVLCVVLGLMTSVGVAWGIAWHSKQISFSSHPSEGVQIVRSDDGTAESMSWTVSRAGWNFGDGSLVANVFSPFPTAKAEEYLSEKRERWRVDLEAQFVRLANDAASRRALARHRPLLLSADGKYVWCIVTLAGWPVRCLAMERACTREDALPSKRLYDPSATITDPAFNLRPHYNALEVGDHLLPTFPLWPGLLADTGIFAGAWAVLIFTLLGVRQWLRARRGGCPQCGYSREGLKAGAACPECGRGA